MEAKKQIYFVGIGGIGMSAIARHYKYMGARVAGYDRTPSRLTAELEAEGIEITYTDDENAILPDFKQDNQTLVVYTPAVPESSKILTFFRKKHFVVVKRAVALGQLISDNYEPICIAGTHGKTTTSTLAAHILRTSSVGCSAFLGGISANYNTNFWHDEKSTFMVTEADEYDRSFHHLWPHLALITAVDADHLDIYGTHDEVKKAFLKFTQQVQTGGALIYNHKIVDFPVDKIDDDVEIFTYSLSNEQADFHAKNIHLEGNRYVFTLVSPMGKIERLKLGLPGLHNIENAVGAIALAVLAGAEDDEIREALSTFRGNRRRFDVHIESDRCVLIDDYAHHPEEIATMITSTQKLFAGRDLTVVFQPHLYTRTRDFADDFARALSLPDHVILLPIYPAREEPIEGVNSEMLMQKIGTDVSISTRENIAADVVSRRRDVVIMMGAGDIETMVDGVEQEMRKKYEID